MRVDVPHCLMFRHVFSHAHFQRLIEPFDDTCLGLLVVSREVTDDVLLQHTLDGTVQEFESFVDLLCQKARTRSLSTDLPTPLPTTMPLFFIIKLLLWRQHPRKIRAQWRNKTKGLGILVIMYDAESFGTRIAYAILPERTRRLSKRRRLP